MHKTDAEPGEVVPPVRLTHITSTEAGEIVLHSSSIAHNKNRTFTNKQMRNRSSLFIRRKQTQNLEKVDETLHMLYQALGNIVTGALRRGEVFQVSGAAMGRMGVVLCCAGCVALCCVVSRRVVLCCVALLCVVVWCVVLLCVCM